MAAILKLRQHSPKKEIEFELRFLLIGVSIVLAGVSFAEPGIRITEPLNGAVVHPGEEIIVRIEAVDGFVVTEGQLMLSFFFEKLTALPASFTITIPMDAAGEIPIFVMAGSTPDKYAWDKITLIVEQTAELVSLVILNDLCLFETDWNGNVDPEDVEHISVDGMYSDGVTRRVFNENLTFVSRDPIVASVDSKGNVKPLKLGDTVITVSSGGVSATIPVKVVKPRGIRPSETIPPTTQINIQPSANKAGWYNSDITITITAEDNEGGSGIQEIAYQFPRFSAKSERVQSDQVAIPFSEEGINMLRYIAYDNERNSSDQQSIEINLDKTPPQVFLQLNPLKLSQEHRKDEEKGKDKEEEPEGNWYELLYSATDSLSGLKSLKAGLAILPISDYKVNLKQHNNIEIRIDEGKKQLRIEAPNPYEILTQLQTGLLTLNHNQILQLKLKKGHREWKIKEKQQGIEIEAPSIIFRAEAVDYADNIATEELTFEGKIL